MADPASTKLGRMLLDKISPVVMVLCTQLVEDSCRKNGLNLIEMLSPFCNFDNIDVPVRTASDQPYRLRKFKLRLFYASEIRQPSIEVNLERINRVISLAGDVDVGKLSLSPPEIESLIATSNLEFVPSWFDSFNGELIDAVSFSEHEAFDHPVACIVVVSSRDEDPLDKCVDLFNTNQLPSLFNDGAMDPKILKLFLLLHDNKHGTPEKAAEILSEMRSSFGVNDCHLLSINSSIDCMEEHQENPWGPYSMATLNDRKLGCFLTVDDVEELRNTMHDISSKHIIPHMEIKIRILNQQISATRKGFRNQIKNLWWRKGKDDAAENLNGPMYTFSSIESQIRVLGDYGFMLHDYELALSNYRLISTDYKLDKAWKHYAGVQEVMGLAYFMLDQSTKDADFCMENAFSTYLKIGVSGLRGATRCGIWWAEMLKDRNQFKDAASVYSRISGEELLYSAAMLEQASYCFLLSAPSLLRKSGFHLILSGELYKKCDQIKHAIRTYTYALSVSKASSWDRIRDHVHFHIGKWYALLGMYNEAIKHLVEVLSCSHQPKEIQELFLSDFLQIVKETGKNLEVPVRLQLPIVNPLSVKVVYEDHRTYSSPAAATVNESLWKSLEEGCIPSVSAVKTNWLESQANLVSKKHEKLNVCVAGEAIKVEVGLRNPLQIPLSLSNVSLICKHSVEEDKTEQGANGSSIDHSISGESLPDTSLFVLSEVDISLPGLETITVRLTVTPRVEGHLKLVGVRWRLSDSVVGIYEFNSEQLRMKPPNSKRKTKPPVKDDTQFLVIKSLPRLEGVIRNIPERVYSGECRRLILELKNLSKISVKNLKLRISNPRFLAVAAKEVMGLEFPSCLKKQIKPSNSCMRVDARQDDVFVFPNTVAICDELPLQWPLWFRAAAPGSISLLMAIYYETEDGSSIITYRTLRMQYNLEVLPSLEVSFKCSPCPSRLQEFLVRMDVLNKTSSGSYQIHQLSCVGDDWELVLLRQLDADSSSNTLVAGQALSSFFKLKNRRICGSSGDETSSRGITDVKILNNDSTELFDTSTQPFNHFNYHERLRQQREHQDHGKSVDFILISESSDGDGLSGGQVFSHHACHCRVTNTSPVWWLIEGPRSVNHDFFSEAFCEISLKMTIHNSMEEEAVLVSVETLDSKPPPPSRGGNESAAAAAGWQDTSRLSEMRVTSDVMGAGSRVSRTPSLESVAAPFVWSGSSSTRVVVDPLSSAEVPLRITVFAPGTFDLSNYSLRWSSGMSSGICEGNLHHHLISVLQKE
ncbi:hypothetical protein M569_12447, partial [Genlisea aurea]